MDLHLSIYGALLLSGLLGSLGHCLGMCGPLVMILGLQLGDADWRTIWPRHALYHASRVTVYALLGAVIGAIGSALGLGDQLSTIGAAISMVLGLVVVLFGLGYLGWKTVGRLEGAGGWVSKAMGRALKQGGWRAVILLGALNGLLPCCLVYAALLAAASTGGPVPGALAMISFGLGTVPALLVVGLGAGLLSVIWPAGHVNCVMTFLNVMSSASARQVLTRVAGILMILVGLQLALRGAAALSLVPHLEIGRIVLW